eukprot:COSAG02_NODE_46978_length_344_cov_1.391837_1_plen_21_part_10
MSHSLSLNATDCYNAMPVSDM